MNHLNNCAFRGHRSNKQPVTIIIIYLSSRILKYAQISSLKGTACVADGPPSIHRQAPDSIPTRPRAHSKRPPAHHPLAQVEARPPPQPQLAWARLSPDLTHPPGQSIPAARLPLSARPLPSLPRRGGHAPRQGAYRPGLDLHTDTINPKAFPRALSTYLAHKPIRYDILQIMNKNGEDRHILNGTHIGF